MKPITAGNGTAGSPSYIPLPWQVLAEFWRLVWVGCVVTFGPHPGRRAVPVQEPAHTSSYAEGLALPSSVIEIERAAIEAAGGKIERGGSLRATKRRNRHSLVGGFKK